MALPALKWLQLPLLLELERAGGTAPPRAALSDAVARHFPGITPEDRRLTVTDGKTNKFENMVAWARNSLVNETGEMSKGGWGVWQLTDKGRMRLRVDLQSLSGKTLAEVEAFAKTKGTIPSFVGTEWKPVLHRPRVRTRQREEASPTAPERPVRPPTPKKEPLASPGSDIRDELQRHLHNLTPSQFEAVIGEVLKCLGMSEVRVTGSSHDGGIDGTAMIPVLGVKVLFQAKKWATPVGADPVRSLIGTVENNEYDRGILITTSGFTAGAKEEAEKPKAKARLVLLDGEKLVSLMIERSLGVKNVPVVRAEIDEGFFADVSGRRG